MARHDREESLEEQLAWLDAIKEQEEAPVIAVKSTAVDDAVISPYPKDPWSLVPAEPDAPSSSLFRTAADPSYAPVGTFATALADSPAEDADAADWMNASGPAGAFTVPPAPPAGAFPARDDDGFLAPLKPLPRQEADDTGGHATVGFTRPEGRTPHPEPEHEPFHGLFEQSHRSADPAETFPLINVESHAPELEPFKPATPEAEAFTFDSTDSDRDRLTSEGNDPDRDRPGSAGDGLDHERFGSGGDAEHEGFEAGGDSDQDRFRTDGGSGHDRSGVDGGSGRDRLGVDGDPGHDGAGSGSDSDDRFRSVEEGFRSVEEDRDRFTPEAGGEPVRERLTFGGAGQEHGHFAAAGGGTGYDRDQAEQDRDRAVFKAADSKAADPSHSSQPGAGRVDPEAAEAFRAPESFGADVPKPATSSERSASGASGASGSATSPQTLGAFGSVPSGDSAFGRESAFGRNWDNPFAPDRDSSPTSERGTPFATGPNQPLVPADGRPFASGTPGTPRSPGTSGTSGRTSGASGASGTDRPSTPERDSAAATGLPERETPVAPGRDGAEPVREPYQARRRHSAPPPAFSAPSRQQISGARPSADSLDPESLLRGRRNAPSGGWRKLIYKASAGLIKPGESPEVRRRRELVGRARTPVATGHHRVAVLSLKGGVGKTTTTVGLGATLAQARGDRVIAVDANPDRGTLSDKVELETSATVRDLLNERWQIKRYVDIRAFTSQAPSRLEILASDRDPSVSEAFSASDYQAVAQVLENFYSICITDCGTGLLHSAMSGVLGLADQLVLVSSPSVDGARAASATLDWLEAHQYEELVRSATVVLCSVRPRSKSTVDLDRLEAHFAARCRAVIRIPYDPHLEEGAEMELDRLHPATRESYLRLAASVGDGFATPYP